MRIIKPQDFTKVAMNQELTEPATSTYRFVVVGDRCGIPVPHRFEQAMHTISEIPAEFVIGVGDYVDGYWLKEEDAHEEWQRVEQMIDTCKKPYLQTPGNHDFGNPIMRKVWHDRKGADYYAIRYQSDLFCFVNSEDPSAQMPDWIGEKIREISTLLEQQEDQLESILAAILQQMDTATPQEFGGIDVSNTLQPAITPEQVAFFQDVIEKNNDCRHIFLITHEPCWKCDYPPFMNILEACKGKSCTLFCGHLHDADQMMVDGHVAIQLQQTGGLPHGPGPDAFLIVEVGESIHATQYDLNGTKIADIL